MHQCDHSMGAAGWAQERDNAEEGADVRAGRTSRNKKKQVNLWEYHRHSQKNKQNKIKHFRITNLIQITNFISQGSIREDEMEKK